MQACPTTWRCLCCIIGVVPHPRCHATARLCRVCLCRHVARYTAPLPREVKECMRNRVWGDDENEHELLRDREEEGVWRRGGGVECNRREGPAGIFSRASTAMAVKRPRKVGLHIPLEPVARLGPSALHYLGWWTWSNAIWSHDCGGLMQSSAGNGDGL
jgi:hypothetical protein